MLFFIDFFRVVIIVVPIIHFRHEKRFTAYGVSTPDLTNPVVEWKGENTFIQNMGINHDFGIYDSPDDFYSQQGSNLTGFKKWLYSHVVRHQMNRKVMKIRERRYFFTSP